ncbi:MAG: hypothetical protein AAB212_05270 [Bacteroidota bacterium]
MEENAVITDKPDLPRRLFWEFRYDDIEWREEYRTVIARVIERGTPEQWAEIIRYYGEAFVVDAIKNEIVFLADYAIKEVCANFHLREEELLCYRRKQSRPGHWI